jgi:hypothetical protein
MFRLPLALSFISHVAALALVVWLSTGAPPIPEPVPLQTIPLLFVEPPPAADAAVPAPQAAPTSVEVPPSPPSENSARAKPAAEVSAAKPPGDLPPAPQVSHLPAPSPPTIATENPTRAEVPAVSQAPADASPSPPSDPVPAPSPQPGRHAQTQARPPDKAVSPRHGSDKSAEKPRSAMRTEHPKRHRAAPVSSANRDPDREPDAASGAGAPARPDVPARPKVT